MVGQGQPANRGVAGPAARGRGRAVGPGVAAGRGRGRGRGAAGGGPLGNGQTVRWMNLNGQ